MIKNELLSFWADIIHIDKCFETFEYKEGQLLRDMAAEILKGNF